MIILISILTIIVLIFIWFHIPFSPLKHTFTTDANAQVTANKVTNAGTLYSAEDFTHLPLLIQKYVKNCGYIGTPKAASMKTEFYKVAFLMKRQGPTINIDYSVYNLVTKPCRIAFIDSSMFGVPFEGYDYYIDGIGGMKGVLGKAITLFHQKGAHMDKASLVTYLAESFFSPNIFLQDFITFETIDEYHLKAVINYKDTVASGIFEFNESGEMIKFTSNDRGNVATDGTIISVPWTAACGKYRENADGLRVPTTFQAIWNYSDGDSIYFDGIIDSIKYFF